MEDFEAAIIQAGFNVADFKRAQDQDPLTAKEQHLITGTVAVLRMSTGDSITYRAGHLSTWVKEFEADLKAGKFGEP